MTALNTQNQLAISINTEHIAALVCGDGASLAGGLSQLLDKGVKVRHFYASRAAVLDNILELAGNPTHYSGIAVAVAETDIAQADVVMCDRDSYQCADIVRWCLESRVPVYVPGDSEQSTCSITQLPTTFDELLGDPLRVSSSDVAITRQPVPTALKEPALPESSSTSRPDSRPDLPQSFRQDSPQELPSETAAPTLSESAATTKDERMRVAGVGEVFLVGAGPGDPDLLTFRALKLIRRADVVLYDRLVSADIVAMCRHDVKKVYVGKQRAEHAMRQELINETLVRYAQQGLKVLRLKGGDPFIFGRGGEEIETLSSLSIPFQIVPGITAATGCASYAGIPLTHRDHAQSCVFVTGHLKAGELSLNWAALAQPSQTVVCYMGLIGLPVFCASLIEHGLPAETPAALIERGTTSAQGVYTGTLATLPTLISRHEVTAPTLIMVGSVVTLRDRFAWFEGAG